MKPWLAAILAFVVVGSIVEAFRPAAGGLVGLCAGILAYWWQSGRYETPERF